MNSEKMKSSFIARLKMLIGDEKPYPWATRIGISQATFNRMWKEGVSPKGETLVQISERTGCSIDWLLTGRGEMIFLEAKKLSVGVVSDQDQAYQVVQRSPVDPELREILEILEQDVPEAKRFILKVLRGKKEMKEGLEGLGLKMDEDNGR